MQNNSHDSDEFNLNINNSLLCNEIYYFTGVLKDSKNKLSEGREIYETLIKENALLLKIMRQN